MDITETYIEMCEKAYPLQHHKYHIGFNEGDTVFDGTRARVVGHDFIKLGKVFEEMGYTTFRFATIIPECVAQFSIDTLPHESIDLKYGEYRAESIQNPVWLPTLGDLIEYLSDARERGSIKSTIERFSLFVSDGEGLWHSFNRSLFPYPSAEQLALAYVMRMKFHEEWDGNEWREDR